MERSEKYSILAVFCSILTIQIARIRLRGCQTLFQESETNEQKAVVAKDIKKEIIAFASCKGGKLYIGVSDDGTVSGLDHPDETSLQVSNMVQDSIKPDLLCFFTITASIYRTAIK